MLIGLAPGAGFDIGSPAELDTYLGAVAGAGFEAVSLGSGQLGGDAPAAARLVAAHGLICTDLMALVVGRDEEAAFAAAEAMRPAVEALAPIGVLTMLHTRASEESIDRLGRLHDRLGVPLAIEFVPTAVATMEAASAIAAALGTDRVRVLADCFHFFRAGSTFEMLETVPLEHLSIVQFDDALPALSDDYMTETYRRTWPGQGELDLGRFASTLRRRGWDGVVSVEVLNADLRRLPLREFTRLAYETTAPYWTG